MSTATLSAPAKTRTARKSVSLADLIVAETAIHPEPVVQSSAKELDPKPESTAAQPLLVFMVAAIAVFALAQAAIALILLTTKIAKFITKKALAFAKAQMGTLRPSSGASKPNPDYSPIFTSPE
jgi:hypothetical protein